MNIIPGAAYLSPSENRIYIGRGDGSLGYLRKPHYLVMFCYSSDMFPTDLVLLYAPGDHISQKVFPELGGPDTCQTETHIVHAEGFPEWRPNV